MQTMNLNDHKFCEMTEHSLEENRHRAYWRKMSGFNGSVMNLM